MISRFYATFGPDHHPVQNAYVLIAGPLDETAARGIMLALYGPAWSSIYDEVHWDAMQARGPYAMVEVRRVMVGQDWQDPSRAVIHGTVVEVSR